MKSGSRQITRTELHKKIWTHPISTVAKEFGLSDNGLRKLCVRNEVPCPPRGFWAKLQAGKDVSRIALRPRQGKETITLDRAATESRRRRNKDLIRTEAHSFDAVVSRNPAEPPHPLIAKTKAALDKTDAAIDQEAVRDKLRKERQARGEPWQVDEEAVNRPRRIDHGRIVGSDDLRYCLVSPELRTRALELLEKLILTGELGGMSFAISGSDMLVSHNGENVDIQIFESLEKRKNPSRDELDQLLSPMIKVPSGQLRLTIQAREFFAPIRIADEPLNPLENQIIAVLGRTLRGLARIPRNREAERVRQRERELKWENEAQLAREAAIRRQIEEDRQREESDRQARLFANAALWTECERVRQYIGEILRQAESRGSEAVAEAKRWAEWASHVVDSRDPARKELNEISGDQQSAVNN